MREEVNIDQFRTAPAQSTEPVDNRYGYGPDGTVVDRTASNCVAYAAGTQRFVLTGTHGRRAGHFFNPAEDDESQAAEHSKASGRMKFEFRKVGVPVYDLYTRFLTTKNPSYLLQAEREI